MHCTNCGAPVLPGQNCEACGAQQPPQAPSAGDDPGANPGAYGATSYGQPRADPPGYGQAPAGQPGYGQALPASRLRSGRSRIRSDRLPAEPLARPATRRPPTRRTGYGPAGYGQTRLRPDRLRRPGLLPALSRRRLLAVPGGPEEQRPCHRISCVLDPGPLLRGRRCTGGHLRVRRSRPDQAIGGAQQGSGLALAGIIVGFVVIALAAVGLLIVLLGASSGNNNS